MASRGAEMRGRTAIVGVGATAQGEHPGSSGDELALDAARLALRDAGIERAAVDGLVTCRSNAGQGVDTRIGEMLGLSPALQRHARLRHLQLLTASRGDGDRRRNGRHGPALLRHQPAQRAARLRRRRCGRRPRGAASAWCTSRARRRWRSRATSTITARPRSSSRMIAVAQREWAQLNPGAIFREPLSLEDTCAPALPRRAAAARRRDDDLRRRRGGRDDDRRARPRAPARARLSARDGAAHRPRARRRTRVSFSAGLHAAGRGGGVRARRAHAGRHRRALHPGPDRASGCCRCSSTTASARRARRARSSPSGTPTPAAICR